MTYHLIIIAKAPVPGRVKTRLCPPCSPAQAAAIAAAALSTTLDAATESAATHYTLLYDPFTAPPLTGPKGSIAEPEGWCATRGSAMPGGGVLAEGWRVVWQRGEGLAARLANGFADTAIDGLPSVLIGMDTPQVTAARLDDAASVLSASDGVLGRAYDGGWWLLGLRDPRRASVLAGVPMSQPDTADLTHAALTRAANHAALTPGTLAHATVSIVDAMMLRDVDTFDDALEVARMCPGTRFAESVAAVAATLQTTGAVGRRL